MLKRERKLGISYSIGDFITFGSVSEQDRIAGKRTTEELKYLPVERR